MFIVSQYKNLSYISSPVNALNVNDDIKINNKELSKYNKMRTIFGALHHFNKEQLSNMLRDVIIKKDGFLAIELVLPTFLHGVLFSNFLLLKIFL